MEPMDFNPEQYATERVEADGRHLDQWPFAQLSTHLTQSHLNALQCIPQADQAIAEAATVAVARLGRGQGRLVYAGAGSAGLQACVDGMELPGTYGWPQQRLAFLLAGGFPAATIPGGAEDNDEAARADCQQLALQAQDVVLVVSASGRTPYALAVARCAREQGALVVVICNNASSPLVDCACHAIVLPTGPEAVAGSTRMAAGTAQKLVLNSLSTLLMAKLGYLYGNLMVNLEISNHKLLLRGASMVTAITGCSRKQALASLDQAGHRVPLAVLLLAGLAQTEAEDLLAQHHNHLREVLMLLNIQFPVAD